MQIWEILGTEETNEIHAIRKAYSAKLRIHSPENDPVGYQELRRAYDLAMNRAKAEVSTTGKSKIVLPEISINEASERTTSPLQSFFDTTQREAKEFEAKQSSPRPKKKLEITQESNLKRNAQEQTSEYANETEHENKKEMPLEIENSPASKCDVFNSLIKFATRLNEICKNDELRAKPEPYLDAFYACDAIWDYQYCDLDSSSLKALGNSFRDWMYRESTRSLVTSSVLINIDLIPSEIIKLFDEYIKILDEIIKNFNRYEERYSKEVLVKFFIKLGVNAPSQVLFM